MSATSPLGRRWMLLGKYAVKRMVARAAGFMPESILSRVVPAAERFDSSQVPSPPSPPTASVTAFIGPTNSAGQGWQWMRAAERDIAGVGAVAMGVSPARSFGYPLDQSVPLGIYRWSRRWQSAQSSALELGFDRIFMESGRPLLGDALGRSARMDVDRLRGQGKQVALVFHGTDIRLPSRHAVLNKWSPFGEGGMHQTPLLERQALRNRALVDETACPTFYSTPDLLLDLPSDAVWLPVVVDLSTWACESPRHRRPGLLRVAHAPSRAAFKGTALIDPVLRSLSLEGVIDYHRVENVPAQGMPDLYRGVDVVLDQFSLGSYGVAACEAMAAGRLVVSNVSDYVRNRILTETSRKLPIIQADPSTVEAVLRDIAGDPARHSDVAREGVEFVTEVHDGRRSATALSAFLAPRTVT